MSVTTMSARSRGSRRLSTVTAIGMLGNHLRSVRVVVERPACYAQSFQTLRLS